MVRIALRGPEVANAVHLKKIASSLQDIAHSLEKIALALTEGAVVQPSGGKTLLAAIQSIAKKS